MEDSLRWTGKTSKQMLESPEGAFFIWCNSHLDYPKRLAEKLGRTDLNIVSPRWIDDMKWMGLNISGVVVDHYYCPTFRQLEMIDAIKLRIKKQ